MKQLNRGCNAGLYPRPERGYTPAMETQSIAADAAYFSDLARETHFYLIRHGESEANARLIVQGHSDYPLDAQGRSQAEATGDWLSDKGVTSLAASPLVRAMETAEILARRAGLPEPEPEPLFIELDTGCFSGLSMEEIQARFPREYEEFRYKSWDAVPGAESASALAERALRAWTYLKDRARETEGAVAAVSHGGFLQWLVRVTFGCRNWMPLLPTGNCGIFHLTVLPTIAGKPAYMQWRLLDHQPAFRGGTVPPIF